MIFNYLTENISILISILISSIKFEELNLEVTQAENWLLLTGFPFLVFFNFFAISGIQEKIEFTLVVRTFPFDLS